MGGGYSLGDTLIGMVILVLGIIPRQLLPLTQQTRHANSPWDSAWQGLLLAGPHPQDCSVSHFRLSSQLTPQLPRPPVYSLLNPQLSTFTSVSAPLPQKLRPQMEQDDRVRRTVGKRGSRARGKDRKVRKQRKTQS